MPISKLFYLLTDHLDSIDTVLDSEGNVLERQDYFSFGSERVTDSTKEAPQTDQGYTGKEKDEGARSRRNKKRGSWRDFSVPKGSPRLKVEMTKRSRNDKGVG